MSEPKWTVKYVSANDDFTLDLVFADGQQKRYDAQELFEYAVFAPLKDLSFFKRAEVRYDTVAWGDEIDIAPEHLYECSEPSEHD